MTAVAPPGSCSCSTPGRRSSPSPITGAASAWSVLRERIEVPQGRLAAATEAALGVLRDDPAVFDFGGQVALVDDGRMLPLDEHALGYHLAGGIQFWQYRKAGGDLVAVDIDPPTKLVRQILSLGPQRQLKALSAVVTAPTIRPDGSVLAVAGIRSRRLRCWSSCGTTTLSTFRRRRNAPRSRRR